MAIQYSAGSYINTTFVQSTGTRAELADWIKGRLVAAGWTSSGSASDYQVTGATTAGGLSARVRVYDPGAGNCARLKLSNSTGSKTQAGDAFLLPAAGKTWQFIGSKYQFFVFTPGASSPREFGCGGTLYTPSFTGVTEALWGGGNAQSDTDAVAKVSPRTSLGWGSYAGTASPGNFAALVNGTLTEVNASSPSVSGGMPALIVPAYGNSMGTTQPTGGYLTKWFNGSLIPADALIAWGPAPGSEPRAIGQLYDAFFATGSWASDQQITYDGHTWQAITNINPGNVNLSQPGSLFVVVS